MGPHASTDDKNTPHPGLEFALEVAWRRKWPALVAFAAAFAAFASVAMSLPDLYRATATVLVESQHVSEELVRTSVSSELETRIQRIRQELTSRGRLGDLITRLDLYRDLRAKGMPFDEVIEQMRRDLQLDLQGVDQLSVRSPTIAFTISYSGRDPQTVAQVANILASYYVDENTRLRAGQAARTAEFLKVQLADIKRQLDEQDSRASAFKLTHLGELPQQIEANLGSLERLNTQLRLNAESQLRAMDRRDRIEAQITETQNPERQAVPVSGRAAELAKLRLELSDLRRQFSDAYPDVIRIKSEIAALERQEHEGTNGTAAASRVDPKDRLAQSLADVQKELVALKDEEVGLRGAIASYERRVENVPKRQEEFQALSRDYATTKERYDTLLKRYEEAQLAANLEQGQKVEQFRVLDSAIPPRNPSAPGRFRLLLAGLIAAIVFAAAIVVLAEKVDTSFHSLEDLRANVSGLTFFSIPVIESPSVTRRQWRLMAFRVATVVIALAVIVAGFRYVARDNEKLVRIVARGRV
jgi:polysaccharide chain length determinant protein (PEP-CTERM system associated)